MPFLPFGIGQWLFTDARSAYRQRRKTAFAYSAMISLVSRSLLTGLNCGALTFRAWWIIAHSSWCCFPYYICFSLAAKTFRKMLDFYICFSLLYRKLRTQQNTEEKQMTTLNQVRKIIGTYEKKDIAQAEKFARSYSKTFRQNRVCIENFKDAHGVTVWNHSERSVSQEIITFQGGVKKRS
jgi:hypothetical protein